MDEENDCLGMQLVLQICTFNKNVSLFAMAPLELNRNRYADKTKLLKHLAAQEQPWLIKKEIECQRYRE